jgi:hypothetical protein
MSGAVVFADDVSPVEHNPAVKVRSKNHFNIANYKTEKDYSNGKTICAISTDNLVIGRTYTVFSAVPMQWFKISNAATGYSCVGIQNDTVGLTSYTFTHQRNVNIAESEELYIYVNNLEKTAMYDTAIMESMGICIVEGSVTTDYIPYIDPSTVTVRRCGKNLLNPNGGSSSGKGLTFTNNGNGSFTVKGTATAAASFGLTKLSTNPMYLHEGVTYTQSVIVLAGSMTGVAVAPSVEDGSGNVTWNYFSNNETKTPEKHYKFRGYEVYVENGRTVDLTFKVQLKVGSLATGFETYKEAAEYIPFSDGTVSGLTSVSPNMTILTDTEGAIVECEYNRDTNKVIEKLTNAIIALGGTV